MFKCMANVFDIMLMKGDSVVTKRQGAKIDSSGDEALWMGVYWNWPTEIIQPHLSQTNKPSAIKLYHLLPEHMDNVSKSKH